MLVALYDVHDGYDFQPPLDMENFFCGMIKAPEFKFNKLEIEIDVPDTYIFCNFLFSRKACF